MCFGILVPTGGEKAERDFRRYWGTFMELVSVIIPMHNAEKFVRKCISSILVQEYSNIEIVVVDDESTDQSRSIVDEMASEDARIQVIPQKKGSAAMARNTGLQHAKGEYLAFVDADDFIDPKYIRALKERMDETGAEIVISGFKNYVYHKDGTYTYKSEKLPVKYERLAHEEQLARFGEAWGKMYRRSLLEKYGFSFIHEDEHCLGEDMPFSLLYFSMCDKIAILSESYYGYVHHPHSTMARFRSEHLLKKPFASMEETFKKVRELGGPAEGKGDFYEWYAMRILCTFVDLTRGECRQNISETSKFIDHVISTYFPNAGKNPLIRLSAKVDVPRWHQVATVLLVRSYRYRFLNPLLYGYCTVART